MAAAVEAERQALEKYLQVNQVEAVVQEVVQKLLAAKPDNPREWLLGKLEQEMTHDSDDLSESELHRLFATTRKITSEIVPKDAIESVIKETIYLLHCDRVSLFVLDKKMNMLRLYASNLVTPIMVNRGQGIAGKVFQHGETVVIPDCYQDHRFDKTFDQKSGYVTRSLIAVPILDFENTPVGVIQAINKLPQNFSREKQDAGPVGQSAVPFERSDEKILLHLSQHVGIAMRNAEVYREAISASERSTGLLNTIQSLSQDLGTQSMLLTITMHANKIVSCERATVFLLDQQELWSVSTDTGQEIRIPRKAGIAGQCCTEAKVINIPDAYADSRFNQEIDKKTGFRTQSILAIPIWEDDAARNAIRQMAHKRRSLITPDIQSALEAPADSGPRVIGVIQMINKVSFDGQLEMFDEPDVEVMELFAKTVGPKLALSSMLARRQSDNPDKKEAELGLGKNADQHQHHGNHKRASNAALMVVGETDEEEQKNS